MSDRDHPLGRRAYDIDDHALLARIDERVGTLIDHAERLNGRITKAEGRLDQLEDLHIAERAAAAERTRWVGIVKVVKDVTPAGGIAAAVALALHQLWGAK